MDRQDQIDLLKRLLHYIETKTTALADVPWRNDVSVYTDLDLAAREQQVLFRRHPLLMGFASEWDEPGAFRTDDYAGVPILIVRGRDGKLRAFLNVCRHRGAKVAQGGGTTGRFVCPYHAWTYDLSGKVIGIPDERCFPGVRSERPSLAAAAPVRKARPGVGDPDADGVTALTTSTSTRGSAVSAQSWPRTGSDPGRSTTSVSSPRR